MSTDQAAGLHEYIRSANQKGNAQGRLAAAARQGDEHPHPFALNQANSVAMVYRDTGRLDEALGLFEETERLARARLGPEHRTRLMVMNQMAECLLKMKRFERAKPGARFLATRSRKNAER